MTVIKLMWFSYYSYTQQLNQVEVLAPITWRY